VWSAFRIGPHVGGITTSGPTNSRKFSSGKRGHLWLHPETVPIKGVIDHRNQQKQAAQEQGGAELIAEKGVIEKAVAQPQQGPQPTDFVDSNLCKQ
jgi:hypothetical protein